MNFQNLYRNGYRVPDETFTGRRTINLGGSQIELVEGMTRSGGSGGMIDAYFPEEKALFVGDYILSRRMYPHDWGFFDMTPIADWIKTLEQLEALDFTMYISSHFENGTKQDIVDFRTFLEKLQLAVLDGIEQGLSVDEMMSTIRFDEYQDWVNYEIEMPLNVQSAYYNLTGLVDCESLGVEVPAAPPRSGVSAPACYAGADIPL
ncbi:MAG: hypothetical protein COA71_09350 [SAR86 cluster bacterium]|uniref:Metallo-beta-lactamase domain-containing protein n=1 Tax=SAR86 cluster bacterium TaxID=2030880 RepID=A0A2A5CBP9_9GAMM|nr:MAG: hypothetical protein COA71_09350 [SAR86 cluster bacterium]